MADHDERTPHAWPRLASRAGPDLILCRARFDRLVNPRTSQALERLVLETPDWVNVVALTPARELVVVRQYRFGTETVETEIPGGVVDPGEDHGDAARRELREETGYTSERWRYLGCVQSNPAFQDNLCHHWLAEDARRTGSLELDPGEDIAVGLIPWEEVARTVVDGGIRHSLVVCALSKVLDLRAHEAR